MNNSLAFSQLALVVSVLATSLVAQELFVDRPSKTPIPGLSSGRSLVRLVDRGPGLGPDLFVGSEDEDLLLRNDGEGRFGAATEVLGTGRVLDARIDDLDGLGSRELVRATDLGIYVHPGQPDGTFGLEILVAFPPLASTRLRVADLDGDGLKDLVFSTRSISWLRNLGGLVFDALQPVVADPGGSGFFEFDVDDLDGDGDGDLVASYRTGVGDGFVVQVTNNGDGTFTAAPAVDPIDLTTFHLVDVDQDGDRDAVVVRETGSVFVRRNEGGTLQPAGPSTDLGLGPDEQFAIVSAVGDHDGDGDPDLAVFTERRVIVLLGDVDETFAAPMVVPEAGAGLPVSTDVADLDLDGFADVVVARGSDGTVSILRGGVGPLLVDERSELAVAGVERLLGSRILGSADLDADGRLDFVIQDLTDDPVTSIAFRDSVGGFAVVPLGAIGLASENPLQPAPATAGDFDGDGFLEVVLTFVATPGTVQVIQCDGTRTPSSTMRMLADRVERVAAGDFDGDGSDDLLAVLDPSSFSILAGDASISFATTLSSRDFPLALLQDYLPDDFDRDGDLDLIAVQSFLGSRFTILGNDGSGGFTEVQQTVLGISERIGVGDIDGDGDTDILSNAGQLLLNDGAGNLLDGGVVAELAASYLPPVMQVSEVHLVDLDLDGDLDVVGDRLFAEASVVLRNVGGQAFESGPGLFPGLPRAMPGEGPTYDRDFLDFDGDGDLDTIFESMDRRLVLQNRLRDAFAPFRARIGSAFRIDVASRVSFASAPTIAFVALGSTRLPQPLSIAVPGFELADPILLANLVLPAPGGEASVSLLVPDDPRLCGMSFLHQTAFLELTPLGTFQLVTGGLLEETFVD